MAATSTGKTGAKATPDDLEAEIARLRNDITKLTAQISATGEHSYSAAKRAATQGAEQLRTTGEAAIGALKANASDIERQLADNVREKPLTALAVAAGVGFLLAMLSRR